MLTEANQGSGATPEPFEVVKGALLRREEVDDHVSEVQQNPTGLRLAFLRSQFDAELPHVAFERIDQRVHLADVVRRGDHEIVGERRNLADVDLNDVLGLAIREDVDKVLSDLG